MAENPKRLRLTLVKSPIGYNKKQKETVRALGLLKMQSSRDVTATPHIQGMINKVKHLLHIEEIDGEAEQN